VKDLRFAVEMEIDIVDLVEEEGIDCKLIVEGTGHLAVAWEAVGRPVLSVEEEHTLF
jgi:hypothetical protein